MLKRKFNFDKDDNNNHQYKKIKLTHEYIYQQIMSLKQNMSQLQNFIYRMNIQLHHNIQYLYNLLNFRLNNIEQHFIKNNHSNISNDYNYFS